MTPFKTTRHIKYALVLTTTLKQIIITIIQKRGLEKLLSEKQTLFGQFFIYLLKEVTRNF